jgi:hypothetical protein
MSGDNWKGWSGERTESGAPMQGVHPEEDYHVDQKMGTDLSATRRLQAPARTPDKQTLTWWKLEKGFLQLDRLCKGICT